MIDIPNFKIYGENDPIIESRIQPKLDLRDWDSLQPSEKEIALRELLNRNLNFNLRYDISRVKEVIQYLNTRFLRALPGKNLHECESKNIDNAAWMDFCNIFLAGNQELVLVMLSRLLFVSIHMPFLDEAKETKDNETKREKIDSAYREFDSLAKVLNHIFDQFCVNIWVTRNGIVPRQDDRITKEIYEPVLKVLSDPKWQPVNDILSDMFEDYQQKNYSEVITKAHSSMQRFLQILLGKGKNGKGEFGKLVTQMKDETFILKNSFSGRIISAIQGYMSSERQNKSTAKPSAEPATSSDALLTINVLMVFIQHCLHNSGQLK